MQTKKKIDENERGGKCWAARAITICAHHEAGHAVVAHALGIQLERIELMPGVIFLATRSADWVQWLDTAGLVTWSTDIWADNDTDGAPSLISLYQAIWKKLLHVHAGPIAGVWCGRLGNKPTPTLGALARWVKESLRADTEEGSDGCRIRELLAGRDRLKAKYRLHSPRLASLLEQAICPAHDALRVAMDMVLGHWGAIAEVAEALLERNSLSFDEFVSLPKVRAVQ